MTNVYVLAVFNLIVLGLLTLDLKVTQRRPHAVSLREAASWTGVWVAVALAFNVGVALWRGAHQALEFLTGYILEASLSVDNVFVFAVIFGALAVSAEYQHRVLFWGVLGAVVMRAGFVLAGVALVSRYHWVLYFFGAFLLVAGAKLLRERRQEFDPERNLTLRLARRFFPITERYEGASFFVRRNGKLWATPLFMILVLVEATDFIFALDSIPAIFGVTQDPVIIYMSNLLAVMGLRSMYFLLARAMAKLRYLRVGVALILVVVGTRMLIARFYEIRTWVTLATISAILVGAVWVSLGFQRSVKESASAGKG